MTSSTYTSPPWIASWTFSRPITPSAGPSRRTTSLISSESEGAGRTHDESPEWMPASSTCSMTAATYVSRAVAERIDVELDRVLEEAVDEHRAVDRAHRGAHLRARRSRPASRGRRARTRGGRAPDSRPAPRSLPPRRRLDAIPQSGQRTPSSAKPAEALAILGQVDRVEGRAEDRKPARSIARASFSGVWPPNWMQTPTGRSRSRTASTASSSSGSK